MSASAYCLLLTMSIFCLYYLWKTDSINRWNSSMRAEALIHFDLSIPSSSSSSSSSSTPRRTVSPLRRRHRSILSKYMLQLYHRRPDTDIVKAIQPKHISAPLSDHGRILEFTIPSINSDQILESAELLGIDGVITRVRSFQDATTKNNAPKEILRSRKEDAWRAFNVTSAVVGRNDSTVKLYVYGQLTYRSYDDDPILLMSYSKTNRNRRQRRSVQVDQVRDEGDERQAKGNVSWKRRRDIRHRGTRHREACRRHSLYVDFALIAFDNWVIAPEGYQAYQCSGKCLLPFADHLNSTQHAIMQSLMYGALQHLQTNKDSKGNKIVGRACCVPTQLTSTSLLYLDNRNSVTYEYSYEDMVVEECGCR